MGGRDGVEQQTMTAGRVAPGKGRVRVHPGRMQDGGGAEADTGRRQPVALAGPPIVGGRRRRDGRRPQGWRRRVRRCRRYEGEGRTEVGGYRRRRASGGGCGRNNDGHVGRRSTTTTIVKSPMAWAWRCAIRSLCCPAWPFCSPPPRGGWAAAAAVARLLLITIMLPERPGTMLGVTLERCNAMAVGGNPTIN